MCSGFTPISAIDEQSEPAVSAKPTDSNIFEFKVTDETSNEVFVNDTGNVDTVSADTSIADTDVAPKSPVTASSPRPLLVQTRQKTGIDHADEDCGSPVDVKPEPLEVKPEEPQITETTTEAETTTPVEPIIETFDQLNVGESLDQPIAAIIPAGIAVMAAVKVVEDLPQQRALPDPVQKESTENTDKQLVEDKIDDPVEAQVSETEVIEERTNTTNEPTLEIETGLSSISDMELANKAAPITPAPIEKVVSVASDDDMPAVTFADIQPEVHAAPTICVTKLATNAVSDITATPIEKEKNTAPVEDQTSPNLEIETEKSSVSVTEPANDDLPAVTIADIEPEVHAVPIISDTEHAVCEVPPPPIEKDESAAPFEDQSSSNQSISSNAEESLESVVELESIIVPEQSTPLNQLGAEKDVNVEESSDQPIAAIIPASIAIIAAVKVVEDVPQQSALPDLKIIPVQNDSTENMTDKIVVDKISDLVVELEKEIIVPEQSTPLVTRGAEKGAIKPHFEYPQSAEDVADEKSFIEDDENDVLTPLEHGGKPVQRTPYEMSVTIEYDDIQCGDTDNMDTEDNTTVVIESTTETNEPPVAKPVVQESVVQDAVVQELVVQEPVVQEPVVEKPVVQEPVVQDPMVQEPVVQEPVVQEPVVQEPVIQPEVQAVETVVPVVEPVVQEPVVQEPVVPNSVVKENLDRSQQIDTEIKKMESELEDTPDIIDHLNVADFIKNVQGTQDEDCTDEVDGSCHGSDTLTQVSDLTGSVASLTAADFQSTETIDSVSTITADVDVDDITNKSNQTIEAFSETEKILQTMTDDALKCLQTDDESDNNYAESEIESDMHALEILKQENGEKEKKRPNSELIESELRNIANDIEHVADNIKRTSSQENILQK